MWPRNFNTSSVKKRVFVALSGGVDSAVSATLLKERGFDVTGVFIKVWQPDFLPCSWREERRDAMRVALALDIPFLFFDFAEEYKRGVIDRMLSEYQAGRTPNPDVLCNKEIKFGAFWQEAKKKGADFMATGHYARIENGLLKEGLDKEKDQTYFLWNLRQEDLPHILFPIGHLEKQEVRRLAGRYKLPVAKKSDSQGLCFIGDVKMEDFLARFIKMTPGRVLNTSGEVIGTHRGAILYTIGERHGFEITRKNSSEKPFYIISKDKGANTITVSNAEPEIRALAPTKILLKDVNWTSEPHGPLSGRIRYRGEKIPLTISHDGTGGAVVKFYRPVKGLSLGQSLVFYSPPRSPEDICFGGGVMDKIL